MRFRAQARLLSVLLFSVAFASFAQSDSPPVAATSEDPPIKTVAADPNADELETIVVAGRYPGPGLWKVRKGDHVLWILGSQSPLPKRMEWDSAHIERTIAASQQVLLIPHVKLDSGVGLFGALALLPAAYRARKSPDGETLKELVTPEQYARWLPLKKRWLGNDRGIEEWRPLFAAVALYEKAIERSGMTFDDVAANTVRKAAKKHRIPTDTPELKIKIANPKEALKEFAQESIDDRECFGNTLEHIDRDLGTMIGRANAWAEGDIERLRTLPSQNQFTACIAAFTDSGIARKQGMHDMEQRLERTWIAAAEAALAKNTSSFAVLPIGQLLQPGGYLDKLVAKGYSVEEP